MGAAEVSHFIRECVAHWPLLSPRSLTVTSTWRPRLTAHCPIGERHYITRSLATDVSISVGSPIYISDKHIWQTSIISRLVSPSSNPF